MRRTRGLRIGTVNGVPVILTAGWVLIVAIMTYVFTPIVQARTGLNFGPALLAATTIPLMLALSVLLHELAHGLTAQHFDIPVHEYVITLTGGHTSFRGSIDTPGVSAAVAFAGPAVNLALAGVGWVAAGMTSGLTAFFFFSLAITNALLAAFNLLPAAPLDGGKVAEAAIWKITGNRLTGMRATGRIGQVIAVLTAVAFVAWPYYTGRTDPFNVMIGIIIAMVIWRGASQTLAAAKIRAGTQSFQLQPYLLRAGHVGPHAAIGQITWLPTLVAGMGASGMEYGIIDRAAYDAVPEAQRMNTPVTAAVKRTTVHRVTASAGTDAITQIAQGLNAGAQVFVLDPSAGIPSQPGEIWLIDVDKVLAELKRRGT